MLLYRFDEFLADPNDVISGLKGGMASHGGFAGVMLAVLVFSKEEGSLLKADRLSRFSSTQVSS